MSWVVLALIGVAAIAWSKRKPTGAAVMPGATISQQEAEMVASAAQATAPAASIITDPAPTAGYAAPTTAAKITTSRVSGVPVIIQEVEPGVYVMQVAETYESFESRFADPIDAALEYNLINASNPELIDVELSKLVVESQPPPPDLSAHDVTSPEAISYAQSLEATSEPQLKSMLLAAGYGAAQADALAYNIWTAPALVEEAAPAPVPEVKTASVDELAAMEAAGYAVDSPAYEAAVDAAYERAVAQAASQEVASGGSYSVSWSSDGGYSTVSASDAGYYGYW